MAALIIITVVVLLGIATGAGLLRRRRQMGGRRQRLRLLSQLGSRHHLSFTGQEVLAHSLVGLDGRNRKLLVLEGGRAAYRWYTINLHEVHHCAVQKIYREGEAPRQLQGYSAADVERVELQFYRRHHNEPLAIAFYHAGRNPVEELPALEARAWAWNRFLLKLLPVQSSSPGPVEQPHLEPLKQTICNKSN